MFKVGSEDEVNLSQVEANDFVCQGPYVQLKRARETKTNIYIIFQLNNAVPRTTIPSSSPPSSSSCPSPSHPSPRREFRQ